MDHSVTLLIQHHVRTDAVPEYEAWLKDIAKAGRQFPGHMGVSIIRPHGAGTPYTMLLRFDSHEHLADWIDSATRNSFMERAHPWLESVQESEVETGLEFWFTPPSVVPLRAKPFKQFLITLSAIYPLTQIVPWLLSPLLNLAPLRQWPPVQGLIVVLVIVYLMVYVIMPRYTRLVARWLFH
ncbi:antibiotic biosynthesis monooxygenase [Vogesella alkaliphila]|uniref:Antibiotic biosynthesis monooxygenase n=1 Tax=Vogesella alkaliphila TaxID=1193621 RepID=A0ABQ2Y9E5_9NEIS|nr:antibiotic biosynthesis monooxygenase [Vogesella alkaliphila]GGX77065.1 antibiotic biosynthesis monooxygenase [Vogesella alkaliphila]